ncbi:Wall-associated receptor kinase-like 2 [Morella rubra]|uniref:Wall-associated receptor kinase-like 2 n=1 Tax=Morella rubra TaxID=262757 RepID=A0A6A1VC20_9ROSI|nr:Wall-associated receptor kinase-like 2 [Morella rubra]
MEEDNLFNIIDNQVLVEGEKEEIIVVANLTRRCLNISGKEQPMMKEVATELEAVQVFRKAINLQLPHNVFKDAKTEMYETWDVLHQQGSVRTALNPLLLMLKFFMAFVVSLIFHF